MATGVLGASSLGSPNPSAASVAKRHVVNIVLTLYASSMGSPAITLRGRAHGQVRVLVVHDANQDLTVLCDLLKKELVVREAATVDEAITRM
jgi:hypothetical protein